MRAAGFEPEDYALDVVDVWPVNLKTFQFFQRLGSRWFVGMSSVTGLRWEAIYPLMDRLKLEPEAWDQLLLDLEVMEQAALVVLNRKDDK